MDFLLNLLLDSALKVWAAFLNNWPFLLGSVFIAAWLKLYLDAEKISAFLERHKGAGVAAATTAAVATPLCSCGTTAVILGMLASALSWAPVIAFMVASPLTSPQELVYSAGLFGWPFAWAFFLASILLGFAGGWAGAFADRRGWLKNQNRFAAGAPASAPAAVPCCSAAPVSIQAGPACAPGLSAANLSLDISNLVLAAVPTTSGSPCCPGSSPSNPPVGSISRPFPTHWARLREFAVESTLTARRLLLMFAGFAFIGYFLNGLMPASWIPALFGSGNTYNVLLAAVLGLPFYINTEASLPLVRAMMDAGMSQGAALAFLISGAGTSLGAVFGALAIARWRVVGLVIGTLWIGAVTLGYLYDGILRWGLL